MAEKFKGHPKWNHKEFVCFLLIYASEADMEFSDSEREYILGNINPDRFEMIKNEFDALSDFERLQIIHTYRGLYFPTIAQRDEILDRISAVLNADGKYNTMEKNLFRMLKKIM